MLMSMLYYRNHFSLNKSLVICELAPIVKMDNISFVSKGIFKELSHLFETWWKMSVDIANSGFFKNFSASSRAWLDISLAHMQTLGPTYSSWLMVPIVLLLTVTVPLYLVHYRSEKRLRALTSNIPGPSTLPIFGNVTTFAGCNLVQFFHKLVQVMNKYGPIVRFWMGDKLYIVISDPENIEAILGSKKNSSPVSKIANGNEKWKIHRRIISSTFNTNVLDQFMENFIKNSLILTDNLMSVADGSSFDIYSSVCRCALDVICETTMGTNVNKEMEGDDEFMENLLQAMEKLGGTFKKPWMLQKGKESNSKDKEFAMKYLYGFVDKVMTEKLELRRNGFLQNRSKQQVEYVQWVRGREMSLLDLLMQDDQLSAEEIRDELCTLIVAGTKVTAVTCCYVLTLLGVHQDIQDKVVEEQERIFGGGQHHRSSTSKDLSSMSYLEKVMKETIRLYPPVPFIFRTIEEDRKLDNGYILPKDSYAVIFSYVTHRNSEYFPDPEVFNPDRFSCEGKHPYAYVPFGGGRRICVAYKYGVMEAKTILSAILREYFVTTPGGMQSLDRNLQAGVVLKPATGFNVQLLPRTSKAVLVTTDEGVAISNLRTRDMGD